MEKVPFLVLMLKIMSKCEPAYNRYNALVTYLVLQTFLVFRYLSVVCFLSRSSSSFLVREDKDNVWQDDEARERLCGVLFRPTIPFTQVLSTTKRLGNSCGDIPWECYRVEKRKRKCLLLRPTVWNKSCSDPDPG